MVAHELSEVLQLLDHSIYCFQLAIVEMMMAVAIHLEVVVNFLLAEKAYLYFHGYGEAVVANFCLEVVEAIRPLMVGLEGHLYLEVEVVNHSC